MKRTEGLKSGMKKSLFLMIHYQFLTSLPQSLSLLINDFRVTAIPYLAKIIIIFFKFRAESLCLWQPPDPYNHITLQAKLKQTVQRNIALIIMHRKKLVHTFSELYNRIPLANPRQKNLSFTTSEVALQHVWIHPQSPHWKLLLSINLCMKSHWCSNK